MATAAAAAAAEVADHGVGQSKVQREVQVAEAVAEELGMLDPTHHMPLVNGSPVCCVRCVVYVLCMYCVVYVMCCVRNVLCTCCVCIVLYM